MLSSKTKALIGIVIAGWLVVLLGLIAWSVSRPIPIVQGSVATTLSKMDSINMRTAGVMPLDVYGENIVGVIPVCQGVTPQDLEQGLDVNPAQFSFDNGVIPEAVNYMLLMDKNGETHVEKVMRADIDLCPNPQQIRAYQAGEMMFFVKEPNTKNWILVG
ncbi:MAG: hypothetical protein SOW59_08690 [Corynebacterium sp.]|nr:hypothetical protein [Corynebacterium sp.]